MKYRKFQLLMSKYGFSLSIMLLELCLVFWSLSLFRTHGSHFMDYCPHSTEYHHNHFDSQP